jgi:SAM-dependent methyltransferase
MATATASETVARSKCFLCDETSEKVIWTEGGMEGLLCRCGMVYTNQSAYLPPANPIEEHHPDCFYSLPGAFKAEWMARHCPRGRLLEIGCGAGFFLAAARTYGYDAVGMEPSRAHDQRLQDLGIPVVHDFVEDNSLPRHSFDVVYHCDLLAHFPDPIRSLSAMCELLSPGGVLCFEIGLLGGVSPFWYPLVGEVGLGPHLWLYSDQAFQNLMARAGLTVRHIKYFGLAPEVIGGRILGVLTKRLLSPALQIVSREGENRAVQIQEYCVNFLRYRVGSLLPHVGPQTLMVVAEPTDNVS